jgi:hypothetical protein
LRAGMPGSSGGPVVTNSCVFYFTREAAGALGARHSPRPCWAELNAQPGRTAPRECGRVSDEYECKPFCVVPAKAGTHNHRPLGCAKVFEQRLSTQATRSMGPCFRRDDVGVLALRWEPIRFSERSSARGETLFITHHLPGRRCHGTPTLSETHLWICCRRDGACCEREGGAAAAGFATTGPLAAARRGRGTCGHNARRCRSSRAGTSALGASLAWARALGPSASLGLAQKALGLAPAAPGLASSLAPPSLVRRSAVRLPQSLRNSEW